MHTITKTFIFTFYEFLIIIKAYLNMEITILPIYSMFQRQCSNRSIIGFIRADNIKIQGFHILCQSYFLSYFSAKAKIIFPLDSFTDLASKRKFI
jgi:hypothetical protein